MPSGRRNCHTACVYLVRNTRREEKLLARTASQSGKSKILGETFVKPLLFSNPFVWFFDPLRQLGGDKSPILAVDDRSTLETKCESLETLNALPQKMYVCEEQRKRSKKHCGSAAYCIYSTAFSLILIMTCSSPDALSQEESPKHAFDIGDEGGPAVQQVLPPHCAYMHFAYSANRECISSFFKLHVAQSNKNCKYQLVVAVKFDMMIKAHYKNSTLVTCQLEKNFRQGSATVVKFIK